MIPIQLLLCFVVAMSLIAFVLCAADKRRAKRGRWRISEAALLLTGLCGGAFGLLLGMGVFRHKTKHRKFKVLVPLECVLWAAFLFYLVSAPG